MNCDNSYRYNARPVFPGGCYDYKATKKVSIRYNEVEEDTLHLCDDCTRLISRDAKRHGYKVQTARI